MLEAAACFADRAAIAGSGWEPSSIRLMSGNATSCVTCFQIPEKPLYVLAPQFLVHLGCDNVSIYR